MSPWRMSPWRTLYNLLVQGPSDRAKSKDHVTNATTDLYFLNALGDLVSATDIVTNDKPIARQGPNTFASGDRLVIVRYITPAEKSKISRRTWKSVDYVLDDAIYDADASVDLPPEYRRRLRAFVAGGLRDVLGLEPAILAPSAEILRAFPDNDGCLIDPCIARPYTSERDLWHHDEKGVLRICFLGTRSHSASLELLRNIADHLAVIAPDIRLTMFFGENLPKPMQRHSRIDNRPPLPWPAFKRFVAEHKFHVCLAPLLPTPFNKGRSITKVLDSASVGAAALYSNRPPFQDVVRHGHNGFLIDDAPENWIDTVAMLARDRQTCRAVAQRGLELANEKGDRERLRRFWCNRLEIECE